MAAGATAHGCGPELCNSLAWRAVCSFQAMDLRSPMQTEVVDCPTCTMYCEWFCFIPDILVHTQNRSSPQMTWSKTDDAAILDA